MFKYLCCLALLALIYGCSEHGPQCEDDLEDLSIQTRVYNPSGTVTQRWPFRIGDDYGESCTVSFTTGSFVPLEPHVAEGKLVLYRYTTKSFRPYTNQCLDGTMVKLLPETIATKQSEAAEHRKACEVLRTLEAQGKDN